MSVHEIESKESSSDCDSKNKMYRRVTAAAADPKLSSLLPLVALVDTENYMLRGIGRPVSATPPSATNSNSTTTTTTTANIISSTINFDNNFLQQLDGDMDIVDSNTTVTSATTPSNAVHNNTNSNNINNINNTTTGSSTATTNTNRIHDTDVCWTRNTTDISTGGFCARILSFHSLLCSCELSCCCNCGPLCSTDCHACFHNFCLRFFPNYTCQRDNDALPPAILDYDKVCT